MAKFGSHSYWDDTGMPPAQLKIRKGLPRSADKKYMERRTDFRMLCADMVDVCWKDELGKTQAATALLEDICTAGACLQLETSVPLGSEIHWTSPKQEFRGYVRYCVYREIGYFVGVEFTSASKWSKKAFRPQHLLDLQKILELSKKSR